MRGHTRAKGFFLAASALLITGLLVLLAGCGSTTSSEVEQTQTAAAPATNFDQIAGMMNDFLNSPANLEAISSTDLNSILSNDDTADDPVVIDVRDTTDYQQVTEKSAGHIPGAINIPFRDIAKPDSIAKIKAELDKNSSKKIVIHCYTGHTHNIDIPILFGLAREGQLGTAEPEIQGLEWGMLSYNTVLKTPVYSNTYPLEAEATPAAGHFDLPVVSDDLQTRAQLLLKDMPSRLAVGDNQTIDEKPLSDYTVIDIRSPEEYAKGHMPGAVNLPYQDLFKKEGDSYPNLVKIDRSKQILVVGERQYEEEFVASGLNLLGISQQDFNTAALGYGIATWNNTVGRQFTDADRHGFPVVTGEAPVGSG